MTHVEVLNDLLAHTCPAYIEGDDKGSVYVFKIDLCCVVSTIKAVIAGYVDGVVAYRILEVTYGDE